MDTGVTIALISSISGIVLAAFSLVTSRHAKSLVLQAEENAKRSEQIRLKATAAGEELLEAFANLIIQMESFLTRMEKYNDYSPSEQIVREYWEPIGESAHRMQHLVYSSAIYTTPEIRESIQSVLQPIFKGGVDFQKMKDFVDRLRASHFELARQFRFHYLD